MTTPLHGALMRTSHFRGETAKGKRFVFCPLGNIVSWHPKDYEMSYCAWCHKSFAELLRDHDQ